jgi:hypothetical protein
LVAEFGQPGRGGGYLAGAQADPVERGRGRLEAVPAEGAGQFLRAVRGELAAQHGPAGQQRDVTYAHPRPHVPSAWFPVST